MAIAETSTPMALRQAAVLSGSSAGNNPSMRVSPSAMAPNNRARCEIDLSPGTRTLPRRVDPAGKRSSGVSREPPLPELDIGPGLAISGLGTPAAAG